MNLVLKTHDRALLSLSSDELLGITNALNEICHGVQIQDDAFQTRLGVGRDFMARLLGALLSEPHADRQTTELVQAWEDNGSVMVRALNVFGDPVEMGEVQAAEFARQLQLAIARAS